MTLSRERKKNWLFPIALSLLLHAPVVIFLSMAPLKKTYEEPGLRLSLRSAPAGPQAAAAAPSMSPPKPEVRPETQPQLKPQPRRAVKPAASAASEPAKPNVPAENGAASESGAAPESTVVGSPAANGTFPKAAGMSAARTPRGEPVDIGELNVTKRVVPDYPAFSRKRGEEGMARIVVTIKEGAVTEAGVYESSGHPRLDRSALRAASEWRFLETDELRVIIPFVFSLTD